MNENADASSAIEFAKLIAYLTPWIKTVFGYFLTTEKVVPPLPLAIVGAGGSGKTTLGRLISQGFPTAAPAGYAESTGIEKYKLVSPWPESEAVVFPGQAHRGDQPLLHRISRPDGGEIRVICVFMTSWGMNSFGSVKPEASKYWAGSFEGFRDKYHTSQLEVEAEFARGISDAIHQCGYGYHFVHVVNKADLWRDRESDVWDYYQRQRDFAWLYGLIEQGGGRVHRVALSLCNRGEFDVSGRCIFPVTSPFEEEERIDAARAALSAISVAFNSGMEK